MPANRYLYWDSCIFLAYVNNEPNRADIIQSIWDEIANANIESAKIITTSLTIAEVSHLASEKQKSKLSRNALARINAMWDHSSILLIEPPKQLMYIARDLMRTATTLKRSLRPADAVHLATASWVNQNINPVTAFNTYDDKLLKSGTLLSIPITEPNLNQVKLLLSE